MLSEHFHVHYFLQPDNISKSSFCIKRTFLVIHYFFVGKQTFLYFLNKKKSNKKVKYFQIEKNKVNNFQNI